MAFLKRIFSLKCFYLLPFSFFILFLHPCSHISRSCFLYPSTGPFQVSQNPLTPECSTLDSAEEMLDHQPDFQHGLCVSDFLKSCEGSSEVRASQIANCHAMSDQWYNSSNSLFAQIPEVSEEETLQAWDKLTQVNPPLNPQLLAVGLGPEA